MMEQPPPEFDVYPVRRVRQGIGPQILQHNVEEPDDREATNQDEQVS